MESFEIRGVRDWGNTENALRATNGHEGIDITVGTSVNRGIGIGVYQLDNYRLKQGAYNDFGVRTWPLPNSLYNSKTNNHADHVIRHAMRQAPDATYFTRGIGDSVIELNLAAFMRPSNSDLIFASNKGAPIAIANVSRGSSINRANPATRGYLLSTFQADMFAYEQRILPVFASGNADAKNKWGWEGSSQGGGFNVISVGAMDHRNGRMSDFTPVRNAPWLTRKPDTYAAGEGMEVFSSSRSGAGLQDGSSYAAPIVTGGIASLMGDRRYLRFRPFEARAMALAGAVTKVTSNRYRESQFDGFSLDSMADTGHFRFIGDTPTWFKDTRQGWWWGKPYRDVSGYFEKGKPAKVALAWDVDPGHALERWSRGNTNIIGQDFDVVIYDSNGKWMGDGQNSGDSKEIVEFIPQRTGYHKIRIMQKSKSDHDGETRLGIAWNRDARTR